MSVSHSKTAAVADWTGTVTVFNSQGSSTTVAATDLIRPANWNEGHVEARTVSGNTSGGSTAASANIHYLASGALTLSAGASHVLWSAPPMRSQFRPLGAGQLSQMGTAQGNSLASIQPFIVDHPLVVSYFELFASINVATAANNSSGYVDATLSCVLYTRSASTLSSLLSWSQSHTQSWSSNATGSVTGVKKISATMSNAQFTLMPDEYFLAVHVSTNNTATGGANTTALANTLSMIGPSPGGSGALSYANFGGGTANSLGVLHGQGIISTGATRATIAVSDYTMSGTRGLLAAPYFFMANSTFQ